MKYPSLGLNTTTGLEINARLYDREPNTVHLRILAVCLHTPLIYVEKSMNVINDAILVHLKVPDIGLCENVFTSESY